MQHFYLANTNDKNSDEWYKSNQVLAPYIAAGIVTDFDFCGFPHDPAIFTELLHRADSHWIAFIDAADEFIYPVKDDTVTGVIRRFENYGGLVMNWCFFGSSGFEDMPEIVTTNMVHRAPDLFLPNNHVKSIVQKDRVSSISDWHLATYKKPWYAVTENKQLADRILVEPPSFGMIRLNHYFARTFKEYKKKQARANPPDHLPVYYPDLLWKRHDRNDVLDDSLPARFGDELKRRLCDGPFGGNVSESISLSSHQKVDRVRNPI